MSVLSFPRLYFRGFMEWNPNTANNNDYLPTYDAAVAALDWEFLAGANPPITPENFREQFRPWVIKPFPDTCPEETAGPSDNCGGPQAKVSSHMPSRWNFYGDNGCSFAQYAPGNATTLTSGGDLAYGKPAAGTDPLLGQPVTIIGNTFGGRTSPARLIDINPGSPFCSQIFFGGLRAGNDQTYIGGPQSERMYSRSFFVPRNTSDALIIAGAIGVVFQTTIPTASLVSANGGGSDLLTALLDAVQAAGAAGLMLRFSAYNTVYYQNGILNGTAEQPRTCEDIYALYREGKVFMNPAYSPIAGVFGVWKQDELATAPGGHMLVPKDQAAVVSGAPPAVQLAPGADIRVAGHTSVNFESAAPAASGPPAVSMGVAWAEIDGQNGLVSLDLTNATPESDIAGTKFNLGTLDVGVLMSDGVTFNRINSFGYDRYDLTAYQAKSGIVDVPFGPEVTAADVQQWMADGVLALRAGSVFPAVERPLTAETDDRGVYVDECRVQQITFQVRLKNQLPPAGTRVRLAQYYPTPLLLGSGAWSLFTDPTSQTPPAQTGFCDATPAAAYLTFPDGDDVAVGADGSATFRIAAAAPGFPIVACYPYLPGQPAPVPQAAVSFGGPWPTFTIGNAFYSAVRMMGFDNALVAQFVDRWNGTGSYAGQPAYDRLLTWQFVYSQVLYVYDMLYPVMDLFMPLGNLQRVEGAIDQLMHMVSANLVTTSTLYMPVTRELSAGKRLILETWGGLVQRNYPPQPLSPVEVPCDPI